MSTSKTSKAREAPEEPVRPSALIVSPEAGRRGFDPDGMPEQYRDLGLVWAQLRGNWSWLVLLRAEPEESPAPIARALCQVGARLSPYPVEFLEASNVDLDSSSRLIARLGTSAAVGSGWGLPGERVRGTDWAPPMLKTIVALESPLANSLALPLALAADGIVLCIRRKHDRLSSVRETIEAVGPQRILCCVLID